MLECQWTALGIWIALKGEQGFRNTGELFLQKGKEGTAATNYCEQLSTVVKPHSALVEHYMWLDHFHPYGFCKGTY